VSNEESHHCGEQEREQARDHDVKEIFKSWIVGQALVFWLGDDDSAMFSGILNE